MSSLSCPPIPALSHPPPPFSSSPLRIQPLFPHFQPLSIPSQPISPRPSPCLSLTEFSPRLSPSPTRRTRGIPVPSVPLQPGCSRGVCSRGTCVPRGDRNCSRVPKFPSVSSLPSPCPEQDMPEPAQSCPWSWERPGTTCLDTAPWGCTSPSSLGFLTRGLGGDLREKEETELGRRESTWLVGVFLVSGIHPNPCALSAGPGCRERPR